MADIQRYINLVTSQHRDKPNFISWLTAALNKVDAITSLLGILNDYFNLDLAIGNQLDTLGEILGRKRLLDFQPTDDVPLLDDDTYRLVLKAKILQNQWDGTIGQILVIWKYVFPNTSLSFIDGQNMTMGISIFGELTQLQKDLITHEYVIPKPQGVTAAYVFGEGLIFGYDLDNTVFSGYDSGGWYNVI